MGAGVHFLGDGATKLGERITIVTCYEFGVKISFLFQDFPGRLLLRPIPIRFMWICVHDRSYYTPPAAE